MYDAPVEVPSHEKPSIGETVLPLVSFCVVIEPEGKHCHSHCHVEPKHTTMTIDINQIITF